YIIPATGASAADPVRNVTRYATYNAGITWSANGKKLAFLSERRNTGSLHVLDLEKPSTEKSSSSFSFSFGSKPLAIDWEDIHRRVKAVGSSQVEEASISPDGSKVAYRDTTTRDLWVASTTGGSMTRLTMGGVAPRQITWSKKRALVGSSIEVVYFL